MPDTVRSEKRAGLVYGEGLQDFQSEVTLVFDISR